MAELLDVVWSFLWLLFAVLPLLTLAGGLFFAIRFVVILFLDWRILGRLLEGNATGKDKNLLTSLLGAVALFAMTPVLVYSL